jgi:TetR/AcrR family transcriptional regulator
MGIEERKEREKEHRKEEILNAAQKVFFDKGLPTATMDEIAEAAELSKGTLYLYYKSKEDLYLGVMMRGMQALFIEYEGLAASSDSPLRKIMKLSELYIDFFTSNRKFFRMFHFLQMPQFHKQVSEEMQQSCNIETRRLWDLVIDIMKKGMEAGILRSDLNPIEIGIILWSSSTSLMLRGDTEGERWKERFNINLSHTLEVSNRLFLNAILTDKGRKEFAAYNRVNDK